MAEFQDSLSLRELIVKSDTNELFYDGNLDGERGICWTRISSDGATFILAATNGFDIWRATFEKQDLIAQCELSELEDLEKFLYIIKYAFECLSVSLVKVGNKIILQCSGQKNTLNFDLFEAKINDKKTELRYMVFHLTDKVKELRKSLTDANDAIEMGRQKEKHGSETQGFGFEPVRKGGPSVNLRRKQQGSSLVNPNSKKAKRAKGISFE
ncbi:PAXX isoform X2 [Paramuricea clavata]|uniref:PAXX isoform X2 n=1 Tax=Paramuricea clavata TaxID=317549 RepID=A0A7D9J6S3_PARCT|nr:PAXX isoform X2 [Paramuricea clavata]